MSSSFSLRPSLQIFLTVACTAMAYFCVGLPLAVLPGWVHLDLGYSAVIAGVAISMQYVATVSSRRLVGSMADTVGPKQSIMVGFSCCLGSGIAAVLAGWIARMDHHGTMVPLAALGVILLSRILLGCGESMIGTGSIAWAIARTHPAHTARVISWNGIATYGAIALGAPVGTWLYAAGGMEAVGAALLVTGLLGLVFAWPQLATPAMQAERLPFRAVFLRVLPYGLALALGAIGFGVISAFIALYYAARGWAEAWVALSTFGCCFVLARILFLGAIARHGGLKVALAFLGLETLGLLLVWAGAHAWVAAAGAGLAGFGFALIFPALGMIVVDLAPPQNRGSAIGAYSMFTDVALCAVGPVAGLLAANVSYGAPFLFGALSSLCGAVLVGLLLRGKVKQGRHGRAVSASGMS
ncbi:MAG: MFS transporter [Sphingomonadales bacterium]|nr:MFS transporter [Sphingomonadales bacterium]MDE2168456.1 MFS transporter [Sphingomonadales bacterium]